MKLNLPQDPAKTAGFDQDTVNKANDLVKGSTTKASLAVVEDSPFKDVFEQDKQEFVRCLLSGRDYVKSYALFGVVDVEFKLLNQKGIDAARQMADTKFIRDTPEWKVAYADNKMHLSISGIIVGDKDLTGTDYTELNAVVYGAVRTKFEEFDALCQKLYSIAADPNCWPATGGAA